MRDLGFESCLPGAPKLNLHFVNTVPQPSKPSTFHQLALFDELNPYMGDSAMSILHVLSLQRLGLLRSSAQIHPAKNAREMLPCASKSLHFSHSAQRLHVREDLQMMYTYTCWHSSFLIETSSPATQLWHSAYAALSGIQTTAIFSVSQLPFTECSSTLMPAENVSGEGGTFPRARMVMNCHHNAVYSPTLGRFSFPAERRDLILQIH